MTVKGMDGENNEVSDSRTGTKGLGNRVRLDVIYGRKRMHYANKLK